ncbi:hypothetical protein D3C87_960030 [compost metagenome]
MVGMLVQLVTFQREMSRPATSRSQRGMMTSVAAARIEVCIMLTTPVMWNIGTTASTTASDVAWPQSWPAIALCMRLEWWCTQPLGRPVVPLV